MSNNKSPLLLLKLYMLNGRGGPWFSRLGPESIEDCRLLPLYVNHVDSANMTVTLSPDPQSNANTRLADGSEDSNSCINLVRRSSLDRMQTCIKGALDWFSSKLATINATMPKSMFTISSPDFELLEIPNQSVANAVARRIITLTTFDKALSFSCTEIEPINHMTSTRVIIEDIKLSWSVIFSAYCYDSGNEIIPHAYSVHPNHRREMLIQACNLAGIVWNPMYWTFDLVLHWLSSGEDDDIESVVAFLETYISMNAYSARKGTSLHRYYQSVKHV